MTDKERFVAEWIERFNRLRQRHSERDCVMDEDDTSTILRWLLGPQEDGGQDVIRITNEFYHRDVACVELALEAPGLESIVATGVAKRNPVDEANDELALSLAYGRALQTIANKLLGRAEGLVKHEDDMRAHKQYMKDHKSEIDKKRRQYEKAVAKATKG